MGRPASRGAASRGAARRLRHACQFRVGHISHPIHILLVGLTRSGSRRRRRRSSREDRASLQLRRARVWSCNSASPLLLLGRRIYGLLTCLCVFFRLYRDNRRHMCRSSLNSGSRGILLSPFLRLASLLRFPLFLLFLCLQPPAIGIAILH